MGIEKFEGGLEVFGNYLPATIFTGDVTLSNLVSSNAITLKPSGDTDDYFTFSTASGLPTITPTGSTILAFGCASIKGTDWFNIESIDINGYGVSFKCRDSGVGLVEVGRFIGDADPYFQIGRDDTGVATNAVTDGLVFWMGAGTTNEAAGQGFGMSIKLGNAASELEERGSWDTVLVTATNAAEDARFDWNLMSAGTMNYAMTLAATGVLSVDLAGTGTAAQVDLFDEYDDALILKQGIQQQKRELLADIGVLTRKDTGSGYMLNVQPMVMLLAGGIYQTRQMLDDVKAHLANIEKRLGEGIWQQ